MKSKHLLSALLSTTLIFAACGNDSADKTEDKAKTEETKSNTDNQATEEAKTTESKETTSDTTETTKENKDAVNLIEKAKDAGKDTKSYHAVLDTTMTADGKDTTVNMDMNVDDKGTTQITTESMGQKMDMYIFDKKVVMSPDSKTFMDVTKAMGARVQKQLEQLDYATALNSLDGYKDAEFKETADGYSLTKKFKNLAEYKKIAEQTGSQELISSIEKQVEDVKGEAVINFDKDYMMKTTETKVDMTIKDKKIATETKANYDNYDKVPAITVPTAAKSAKPLEEVQKEMQDKMNSSSTETSTEAK
ncbi:hypothetical protein KYI11_09100 [Macrococcoides bohemicum]|uniref:DUF1307 domain-containing protein n=1 Tax=Macrococcoides bohemicum TaxID=1903056 RepID=A0AAJ4TWP4_9STAP|nr:DUF6612 family protein [Macrococcus bohemicus]QYA41787.1 hypothetical protein KYI11_09100 [Macrococcus bohemicus]